MKLTSLVLLVTLSIMIVALFFSNVLIKEEYDKIDKSDNYWTYGKILEQPFTHLKIEGGNISNILFEPNQKSSVRVIKNWSGYVNNTVKAFVKNDTLFLSFPNTYTSFNEKRYLGWTTTVRLFSPELLSIDGFDTNIKLTRLKQKNLSIHLAGKSKLEVESYVHNFDSLGITQTDSSIVKIAMSPDQSGSSNALPDSTFTEPAHFQSWETMFIKSLQVNLTGLSLLDVGHAQTRSMQLDISDSSGIILSGGTLRQMRNEAGVKRPE